MQLQQTQWIPVALWALHRTVRRRSMSDAAMLGVAAACQLFSCIYFGLMLLPFSLRWPSCSSAPTCAFTKIAAVIHAGGEPSV